MRRVARFNGGYSEAEFQEMTEHQRCYVQDTLIIQMTLLDFGVEASMKECYDLWGDYSGDFAAGWLGLPDDTAELLEILSRRVDKLIGDRDA